MSQTQLYVFSYDITDDRTRGRVARTLEKRGVRVQESVFELRLARSAAQMLGEDIKRHLDPGDKLRVYWIPDRALAHCVAHGGAPIAEAGDYLMF